MARLPLAGLRVLEITVVWAGPYCGSFLADLGAEVIRVESTNTFVPLTRGAAPHPPQAVIDNLPLYSGGLPGRVPGDRPFNRSPMFNSHARNKRSMTVNLLEPGGREVFDRLVAVSDVLIENNPTETMEKLGISYESLKAVKDDFIMLRMPAYGSTGPYRDFRAHGVHIEGVVGHTQLRGYADTDPSYNTTVLMSDAAAGVQGAFAVLAALRHRKRTGEGQLVELGQAENFFPYLGEYYLDYAMNGRTHGPLGNRHPTALQNCYPCAGDDRWLVITVYDHQQWLALCDVIGAPQLASDTSLADAPARAARQDDIDQHIAAWTRTKNPTEAMNILQEAGVPAGAVLNQADAFADPHIQSREFFREAYQADCGTHLYPGPLYRMSDTPLGIRRGPAMLGQDNESVTAPSNTPAWKYRGTLAPTTLRASAKPEPAGSRAAPTSRRRVFRLPPSVIASVARQSRSRIDQRCRQLTVDRDVPIIERPCPRRVTVQTCGDLPTIRPIVEGQPSTVFPLQTVSVPSNVNSYLAAFFLYKTGRRC